LGYFGCFPFFFSREGNWATVVVDKAVLAVGPVDVLSVICPCKVMPIGDIKALDSWMYFLPMISSKWFSFVSSRMDYMPGPVGAGVMRASDLHFISKFTKIFSTFHYFSLLFGFLTSYKLHKSQK